jgi:hypothetical protein
MDVFQYILGAGSCLARVKFHYNLKAIGKLFLFGRGLLDPKMGIVFHARHKKTQKTRRHQVERLMTKKVIAIAVCEVLSSFGYDAIETKSAFALPKLSLNCISNPLIF